MAAIAAAITHLHLSIVGCLAGTKDLLAIVSSHKQALKAIAAVKSAISCKNRILSVRTTDFELLPCGSKATELLQILVATIIDHCPSVYANKLKIARGIFPNGLAIIDDSRKLVVYSSNQYDCGSPDRGGADGLPD